MLLKIWDSIALVLCSVFFKAETIVSYRLTHFLELGVFFHFHSPPGLISLIKGLRLLLCLLPANFDLASALKGPSLYGTLLLMPRIPLQGWI